MESCIKMEDIFRQESYSEFRPLRQSSTIGDQTLPMNGTDLYANVSTVWPDGFLARQEAKEKASGAMTAANEGIRVESLHSSLFNVSSNTTPQDSFMANHNESLMTETSDCSSLKKDASFSLHEGSTYGSFYYTALDFTQNDNQISNSDSINRENLNDSLSKRMNECHCNSNE